MTGVALRVLNGELVVAMRSADRLALIQVGDRMVLPVFAGVEHVPPELPPGCVQWYRTVGHELVALLPDEVYLHLQPPGDTISVAELRRPTAELVQTALAFQRGEVGLVRLLDRFREAVVYCEAGERPGFMAYGTGVQEIVPVFSSLLALGWALGDTAWFSSIGQDILDELPRNCRLVLDPGMSYSVEFRAQSVD